MATMYQVPYSAHQCPSLSQIIKNIKWCKPLFRKHVWRHLILYTVCIYNDHAKGKLHTMIQKPVTNSQTKKVVCIIFNF